MTHELIEVISPHPHSFLFHIYFFHIFFHLHKIFEKALLVLHNLSPIEELGVSESSGEVVLLHQREAVLDIFKSAENRMLIQIKRE